MNNTKSNLQNSTQTGPIGPPGPRGPIGPKGLAGYDGNIGKDGLQGPIGNKGLVGDKGLMGDKGLVGEQGIKGVPGDKGTVPDNIDNQSLISDKITTRHLNKYLNLGSYINDKWLINTNDSSSINIEAPKIYLANGTLVEKDKLTIGNTVIAQNNIKFMADDPINFINETNNKVHFNFKSLNSDNITSNKLVSDSYWSKDEKYSWIDGNFKTNNIESEILNSKKSNINLLNSSEIITNNLNVNNKFNIGVITLDVDGSIYAKKINTDNFIVSEFNNNLSNIKQLNSDKINTKELISDNIFIKSSKIDNLVVSKATIDDLTIKQLNSDNMKVNKLESNDMNVVFQESNKINSKYLNTNNATIDNFIGTNMKITHLDSDDIIVNNLKYNKLINRNNLVYSDEHMNFMSNITKFIKLNNSNVKYSNKIMFKIKIKVDESILNDTYGLISKHGYSIGLAVVSKRPIIWSGDKSFNNFDWIKINHNSFEINDPNKTYEITGQMEYRNNFISCKTYVDGQINQEYYISSINSGGLINDPYNDFILGIVGFSDSNNFFDDIYYSKFQEIYGSCNCNSFVGSIGDIKIYDDY